MMIRCSPIKTGKTGASSCLLSSSNKKYNRHSGVHSLFSSFLLLLPFFTSFIHGLCFWCLCLTLRWIRKIEIKNNGKLNVFFFHHHHNHSPMSLSTIFHFIFTYSHFIYEWQWEVFQLSILCKFPFSLNYSIFTSFSLSLFQSLCVYDSLVPIRYT